MLYHTAEKSLKKWTDVLHIYLHFCKSPTSPTALIIISWSITNYLFCPYHYLWEPVRRPVHHANVKVADKVNFTFCSKWLNWSSETIGLYIYLEVVQKNIPKHMMFWLMLRVWPNVTTPPSQLYCWLQPAEFDWSHCTRKMGMASPRKNWTHNINDISEIFEALRGQYVISFSYHKLY